MSDRLTEIKERCAVATPEPWEVRDGDPDIDNLTADCRGVLVFGPRAVVDCRSEAAFVAHARSDIPWLLSEVKRLRAAVAARDPHIKAHCGRPIPTNEDPSCAACLDDFCVIKRFPLEMKP